MKGKILIISLIFNALASSAQFYEKPFIIRTGMGSGFNIPVYKALGYLIEDDVFAVDLSLSFQSAGNSYWEKIYNFPRTGIGFSSWTLGNNEILGNAYSLYSFINVPLRRNQGKFSVNVQLAAGSAYLPLKFDINTNPLNRAIGSNYNIFMRLAAEGRLRILPLSEISVVAGLAHFSNGKTRSPNYGINIAAITFGVNCFFNQEKLVISDPEIPPVNRNKYHSVFISAGPKVYDNLYGYPYLSVTVSYNLERFVNNFSKAGIGADLFYDSSIGEALRKEGINEDDFIKLIRAGIHGSYALRYKRTMAGLQIGYYLYSKKIVLTSIYNKIYLQYMLSDNITGSVSIRSHWGKADCMEYGIGYTW